MNVYKGAASFPENSGSVVLTIGNFDGVHLGHQALCQRTGGLARELGALSVALTFDPHPRVVLSPDSPRTELCDLEERAEFLGQCGMTALIVEGFTTELASQEPKNFLDFLSHHLRLVAVVVGHDFRFGRGQSGDSALLEEWCAEKGVRFEQLGSVVLDGVTVSSSQIRQYLMDGNLSGAEGLLGRPYFLKGPVTKGEGRGRKLGVPTANFIPTTASPLRSGVYVGWATIHGTRHRALLNIGTKKTFHENYSLTYECHILDFNKDIYGEILIFEPRVFVRDERKFSRVEDLILQIGLDERVARERLK